jgi:hypothetical protein
MTRTAAQLLVLSCIVAGGLVPAVSCGGKPAASPPPPAASASATPSGEPMASASASPAGSASASDNSASGTPAPLASVLLTDSSAVQKLFDAAAAAPAATLKASGATGGDALAKGVRESAKQAAPGMDAEGPLAMGSLKEKQHLQTDITLKPGRCYVLVGFSQKVKDLDLHLLLPPGILSGQDLTDDNKPVIGRAPDAMCPVAATAVTYKLDIFADQGAGDVAVQLYSKAK